MSYYTKNGCGIRERNISIEQQKKMTTEATIGDVL